MSASAVFTSSLVLRGQRVTTCTFKKPHAARRAAAHIVCAVPAVPGLKEFAASLKERQRRIPDSVFKDPLMRIFDEFDQDSDGHLTAFEVSTALSSVGVTITEQQVQDFINEVDANNNGKVEREEFSDLIAKMAEA